MSKAIDAVGVLFAGWFVDRAPETKWGKARPFELSIIGVWVAAAAMFAVPGGLGDTAKYIWLFVAYLLVTAVFGPLLTANDPLYLARAWGSREAITRIQMRSGIFTGLFAVLTAIGMPLAIDNAGKDPGAWTLTVTSLAVPMIAFGLLRFFFHHERFQTESPDKPRVTLRDIMTVLRSNPYLWSVAAINFVASFVGGIGVGTYYYRYVVGDLAMLSIAGAFNLLMLPVLLIIPKLARRFSIAKIIFIANIIGAVGYLAFSLGQLGTPFLVLAVMLTGLGAAPLAYLLPVLIVDNSTYNEWKGNRRLESVGGSVTNFSANVAAAMAAGIAGVVLSFVGYDGSLEIQTAAATNAIIGLMSWLPAALSIVSAVVALACHRFERELPTITREIDLRNAQKAPAEAWADSVQSIETETRTNND